MDDLLAFESASRDQMKRLGPYFQQDRPKEFVSQLMAGVVLSLNCKKIKLNA